MNASEFDAPVPAGCLPGPAKHKGQLRLLPNLDRVVHPAAVNPDAAA